MTRTYAGLRKVVLGSAAAAALLLGGAGTAHAQQRVNETRRVSPAGTVEIQAQAGTVTVVGWNRSEVQVTGTLGRGTERLHFGPEGGRTVVRVVVPRNARNARPSEIQVRVPARSTVQVRTVSADASVDGVAGAVDVRTVGGDIRVAGTPREVEASTRGGDVALDVTTARVKAASVDGDVSLDGRVNGRVEVASVGGDVTVAAPVGEVQAASVNGDVTIASMTGRLEVTSVSGDVSVAGRALSGQANTVSGMITIRGDLARDRTLSLNSHGGDIELALPRGAGADVDVSTFGGAITSHLSSARVQRLSGREQRITVGRGGAKVTVRTFSGDVKLTGP